VRIKNILYISMSEEGARYTAADVCIKREVKDAPWGDPK
jgi:hypothetical protein